MWLPCGTTGMSVCVLERLHPADTPSDKNKLLACFNPARSTPPVCWCWCWEGGRGEGSLPLPRHRHGHGHGHDDGGHRLNEARADSLVVVVGVVAVLDAHQDDDGRDHRQHQHAHQQLGGDGVRKLQQQHHAPPRGCSRARRCMQVHGGTWHNVRARQCVAAVVAFVNYRLRHVGPGPAWRACPRPWHGMLWGAETHAASHAVTGAADGACLPPPCPSTPRHTHTVHAGLSLRCNTGGSSRACAALPTYPIMRASSTPDASCHVHAWYSLPVAHLRAGRRPPPHRHRCRPHQ